MKTLLLFLSLLLPGVLLGAIQPAKIFTDNMVLQRKQPIHIWGTEATPGSTVSATLAGNSASATASPKGEWLITLPAIPSPVTTPLTLTLKNGKDTLTLDNILIGDVWVCAGQSNMSLTVAHNANINPDIPWSFKQDIAYRLPDFNPEVDGLIRNFGIEKVIPDDYDIPRTDFPEGRDGDPYEEGTWKKATPETAGAFSATGFYFSRAYREARLRSGENIPIGLIMTAWGGTPIESWMSLPLQKSRPDFAERLKDITPTKLPSKGRANLPSSGFNSRIHPLRNLGVCGVLWDQGGSNAGAYTLYQAQLPAMAQEWRKLWNNPDLPFFIIELSPLGRNAKSGETQVRAWMREAQETLSQNTRNFYAVSALDLGTNSPIPKNTDMEVHSRDREILGKRVALVARQYLDDEPIQSSGPKVVSVTPGKKSITLTYDQDLTTNDGKAPRGFEIAEENLAYTRPSKIVIEKNKLHLFSEKLTKPVAIRYGWSNAGHALAEKTAIDADEYPPPANLAAAKPLDGTHLPALPFRHESKLIGNRISGKLSDRFSGKDWDRNLYERSLGIIKTENGLQRTRTVASEYITYRSKEAISDFTLTLRVAKKSALESLNPARRIFVSVSHDGIRWSAPAALSISSQPTDKEEILTLTARPSMGILKSHPVFLKIILPSYLSETATLLQSVDIKTEGKAADYPLFPVSEATTVVTTTAIPLPATKAGVSSIKDPFNDFSKALAKSDALKISTKEIDGDSGKIVLGSGDNLTLNYQGQTLPGVLLYSLNNNDRLELIIFHYGKKAAEAVRLLSSADGKTWNELKLNMHSTPIPSAKGWTRSLLSSDAGALKDQKLLLIQLEAPKPIWAIQLSNLDIQ